LKIIKLNEFEAIYADGTANKPDERALALVFGDESFTVMILGFYKTEDKAGKKELQEIFQSIYYDKSLQIDPLELADFEFDQTITGFKYAMTVSNLFLYTEKGESDAQNPTANALQIMAFSQLSEKEAENHSNDLLRRYEQSGVKLDNKIITQTKINNHIAFVVETKIKYEGKEGIMYQAVLLIENTTISFVAWAYNDFDNYLTKFKKTVETIKMQ